MEGTSLVVWGLGLCASNAGSTVWISGQGTSSPYTTWQGQKIKQGEEKAWLSWLPLGLNTTVQFSSVIQSCPTLCNPMDCSTPGLPVHHQLLEFTQTHAHWVGEAIRPSHPASSPSPPAFNPSQHQGLFKWVSSFHQVAKLLEFQLHYQSFQWTLRTDLL